MSWITGAVPRYGTIVGDTPILLLSSTQARCELEPAPALPLAILPALAFRCAANSASVLPGVCVRATSTIGAEATMPTGSKSLSGWNGRFGKNARLKLIVLIGP